MRSSLKLVAAVLAFVCLTDAAHAQQSSGSVCGWGPAYRNGTSINRACYCGGETCTQSTTLSQRQEHDLRELTQHKQDLEQKLALAQQQPTPAAGSNYTRVHERQELGARIKMIEGQLYIVNAKIAAIKPGSSCLVSHLVEQNSSTPCLKTNLTFSQTQISNQ